MKKNMNMFFCVLSLLLGCFVSSCQPNSDTKQEITQINYIVPIWKGSLSSEPVNPELGWAYYNTSVKKSFIYDGSSWQIMSQDGSDGSGIIWQGELSSAPSNPQLNWAYYNKTDGNSYIYNGSAWDLLAKSGRDGASGILLWLGSYSSAPANPSNGWAYYNTTDGVSYIYDNGNWTILARDGNSIFWKGALNFAPQNPSVNWAYYNITEQTSYIYNGTSWDILAASLGGDTTVTVSVSWLGTFTSAPLNPVVGNGYYNSTLGASYIYDGSVWQQISKDGKDGANGSSTSATGYLIIWKGSFTSAPTSPKAGWAYYNASEKKSYVYDGSSWQIMAQDGVDGNGGGSSAGSSTDSFIVFMGETSEVIDGVTYTVKSYADVYAVEPYFYTYYKYYYLNGKLRRSKIFYHNVGCDLDYTYLNFVEHECGNNVSMPQIYTYYENGKVESYTQSSKSGSTTYKYITNFNSDGYKVSYVGYQNNILSYDYTYYTNGNYKTQKNYKIDVYPSYLNYMLTYYENGKEEYRVYYSVDGTETSKTYYTYYDSGNKKTYDSWSKGTLISAYTYYDDALTTTKSRLSYNSTTGNLIEELYYYANGTKRLEVDYNTDGSIDNFDYHFISGYTQYYYTDSGYLYTYPDGATTGTSTSSGTYSSKASYTPVQASAKLSELKGE